MAYVLALPPVDLMHRRGSPGVQLGGLLFPLGRLVQRGVELLFEGGRSGLEFVGTGRGGTHVRGARETKPPEDSWSHEKREPTAGSAIVGSPPPRNNSICGRHGPGVS